METENTNRKGVVYVRVSSHEQLQGTSLEGQEKACREYAQKENIQMVRVFVERGESATAANRTELIKALDFCNQNKGNLEAFIVWKVDRFARNQVDHFALRAQLSKYGVRLHSVTEPISDDPIGQMTEGMLAAYAQFENQIRKQRCEGGMRRKVEEGIWPWQPPIGYINAKKLHDRRKTRADEPDPERFFLIQKAFREYMTGNYAAVEVCKMMTLWGVKTRTGIPMRKQLFERMLRDPFYSGMLKDPWSGRLFPGKHMAMITPEEFKQIQAVKKGFSRYFDRPRIPLHDTFPLRRFIACVCGRKLTGSSHQGRTKKYPYYHCQNSACAHHAHGITKDTLEQAFIALLRSITPNEDFLKLLEASVLDEWKSQHVVLKSERKHYEDEEKRLEARKEQLLQMRVNLEISKEEYLSLKNDIENKLTGTRISRNEAKTDEFNIEALISYTVQFMRDIARQWQEMDIRQKQQFQKMVLPSGITFDKTAGALCTAELSPLFKFCATFGKTPLSQSHFVAGAGIAPAT